MTTTETRAYGKLRDLIEAHGGTMEYQKEGFQYGAWVLELDGKSLVVEATGRESFPVLDRLYVPKVVSPKTYHDRRDDLLDDAEVDLLALLK